MPRDHGALARATTPGHQPIDAGASAAQSTLELGLLTGGDDLAYSLGLAGSLTAQGVSIDFIGSDNLDTPELRDNPLIRFLNLRGDQRENVPLLDKVGRILKYYARLIGYAAVARPRVFHILWNNKFETFDRTLLMLYYRICRRSVVLTAHNVNVARRDSHDSLLNRLTLRIQYHLAKHIFVHTEKMRDELRTEFGVRNERISVIPFGINETSPRTDLTNAQAKRRLGVSADELTLLFFGQIAPYKGLEYLVEAMPEIISRIARVRLVIAGKVKRGHQDYWERIEKRLEELGISQSTIRRIEHIPDEDIELYFKAADALVVPYLRIFQSGVPFLAYSFGLPVIATDVGELKQDIVEGETGFTCNPADPGGLAMTIERYSESALRRNLGEARPRIIELARERHSWETVARITRNVYADLLAES